MTKTKTTTFSEVSTEALVQQFLVYITHSESLCQDPMTDIRHQMKAVQAIEVILDQTVESLIKGTKRANAYDQGSEPMGTSGSSPPVTPPAPTPR